MQPPRRPMSPRFARWAAALLILPTLAAAQEGEAALPAVSVARVANIGHSQPKTYVGTVEGAERVNIVARVSGTLLKVNFREGAMVKAGDVLFEIEDTVYDAKVRVAQALIEQAQADFELAIKEHERSQDLLKSKAIAAQSFDMTLATQDLKKARVDEAKANLILARHDLEHCRIVSPIHGRIGEKAFSDGNYITPNSGTLAVVVRYQPVKVRFSMSESDFFRYFRNHDRPRDVDLGVVRANGERYDGSIEPDFVDNEVDSRTDTITVFLLCDNANDQLLPGGFVQVRLAERFAAPLPAVSTTAIMTDGSRHYVFVVGDGDVIERRTVTPGPLVFDTQTVTDGLKEGERVVVGGMNKAAPGMRIRPVESNPSVPKASERE